MSECNCNTSGDNTSLPTLADVTPQDGSSSCVTEASPVSPPCPNDSNTSVTTGASAGAFLNAAPTESMTILGRTGSVLSKFTGSGFLKVNKGVAHLVGSLPMKVDTLYHFMSKYVNSARASVGDPRPYPFKVIADKLGTTHLVSGLVNNNSVEVWDSGKKTYNQIPVASFPVEVIGGLPKLDSLELTGFGNPSNEQLCAGTGRPLHALKGNGLLSLIHETTEEGGCSGEKSLAHIATFPADDREYYIRFSKAGGIYYEPKDEVQDGQDGVDGLSAYQSWLNQGNTGSEEDFVDTLGGSTGKSSYEIWLDLGNTGSMQDFLDSQNGTGGASAYESWLALGNTGTVQDFIDSLSGTDGSDQSGNLVTTNIEVDQSSVISSLVATGADLNQSGQVALNTATRADAGWLLVAGTGVFTFTSVDVLADHVVVNVSVKANISSAGNLATENVEVNLELSKGGTLLATSSGFLEKGHSGTQLTFNLAYTDPSPNIGSYALTTTKVNASSTAVITILGGVVSANAVKKRGVVETAQFVV